VDLSTIRPQSVSLEALTEAMVAARAAGSQGTPIT
jgi:hypothetical protein